MPTILCYGDSNTHGTAPLRELGRMERFGKGARWPDVMAARLGDDFDVVAEGLPGRTTVHDDPVEGGRRSGIEVLPAILMSHVPVDLMLLMLGTNDLKPRFSVTAPEIARSLERLVLEARGLVPGLDILLVSPAPVIEAGCLKDIFQGAGRKQENLSELILDVTLRQGCGFLDAGAHVKVSPVDGVHWTEAGHRAFGEAAARAVLAHFETARG
jgi:lysophospholipase L1-like esterase